jgi:hypothetical protein
MAVHCDCIRATAALLHFPCGPDPPDLMLALNAHQLTHLAWRRRPARAGAAPSPGAGRTAARVSAGRGWLWAQSACWGAARWRPAPAAPGPAARSCTRGLAKLSTHLTWRVVQLVHVLRLQRSNAPERSGRRPHCSRWLQSSYCSASLRQQAVTAHEPRPTHDQGLTG